MDINFFDEANDTAEKVWEPIIKLGEITSVTLDISPEGSDTTDPALFVRIHINEIEYAQRENHKLIRFKPKIENLEVSGKAGRVTIAIFENGKQKNMTFVVENIIKNECITKEEFTTTEIDTTWNGTPALRIVDDETTADSILTWTTANNITLDLSNGASTPPDAVTLADALGDVLYGTFESEQNRPGTE